MRPQSLLSPLAGLALLLAAALAGALFAGAQEDDSSEKGALVLWVEDTISTPDRRISLGRIDGALSSDVRIDRITIADRQGVWLTIEGAHLVWSRLALLKGTLDIDLLEARSIRIDRRPVPPQASLSAEAGAPLALPEMPVEVAIDRIAVPEVSLAAGVLEKAARLSVDGALGLADTRATARMIIARTDETPGTLRLDAAYEAGGDLSVDLAYAEPPGGLMAAALDLDGRPALDLAVSGAGPVSDFTADIALAADGATLLTGTARLASGAQLTTFGLNLDGTLSPLLPAAYAAYADGASTLAIDGQIGGDGSTTLDRIALTSGIASLSASARLAPDGFPEMLRLRADLEDGGRALPLPGMTATTRAASIAIDYSADNPQATADMRLDGYDDGRLVAGRGEFKVIATPRNIANPQRREIAFTATGALSALSSPDPGLSMALGDALTIGIDGLYAAGRPLAINRLDAGNRHARIRFDGTLDGATLTGRSGVEASDLAVFGALAGRDLAGSLQLDASGSVGLLTGAADLSVEATAQDLRIGDPSLDGLLAGHLSLAGGLRRDETGLGFSDLAIDGAQLKARVDGGYGRKAADLKASLAISDLAVMTPKASGALQVTASVTGPGEAPEVSIAADGPALLLSGHPFSQARLRLDGRIGSRATDATASLSGILDGQPVTGGATLTSAGEADLALGDLALQAPGLAATGNLILRGDGRLAGRLAVNATDLSAAAPLLLAQASGAAFADITLEADGKGQSATVIASLRRVIIEGVAIGEASADLRLEGLDTRPSAEGRLVARDVTVAGTGLRTASLTARRSGEATALELAADLAGGRLDAVASLDPLEEAVEIRLHRAALSADRGPTAALDGPVTLRIDDKGLSLAPLRLVAGSASLSATATLGAATDVRLSLERLPLALANAVMPALGLSGTATGKLAILGAGDAPDSRFDLDLSGVGTRALAAAGIPAVNGRIAGERRSGVLTVDTRLDAGGGAVSALGRVAPTLDLEVTARRFPLAALGAGRDGAGLAGSLDASARVTGTLQRPVAAFEVDGRGLSARQSREAGLPAVDLLASGRLAEDRVTFDGRLSGPGMTLAVGGLIPLAGNGLDLSVRGDLPLSLLDRPLAERGTRFSGTVSVDVAATGSLATPRLSGRIGMDGGRIIDPESGQRLSQIRLAARLEGDRAIIERLTARPGGRGSLGVSGSIGLRPEAGLPADLAITVDGGRFTDGSLVSTDLDADLSLVGPLTGNALLSGTVELARTEITIPEQLPVSATFLDVSHRLPPANVERTLERIRIDAERQGRPVGLLVDLALSAPNRVFVRGRGIDAELGGNLRISGTLDAVSPVGGFRLIRGRLDIAGQRIGFDSGSVSLVGDLDPYIDFTASTSGGGITAYATISGRASSPQVVLSSVPELPQDEVLSHLLFGRSVSDLSPLQIASLAAAVAELAGAGGGGGLLTKLRQATGLDDLEIVTDNAGGTGVKAGRYVTDNVYLGVTAAGNGQSNVSVNLDLTDDLKARAEVGPDSGSSFGLFYETEY